MSSDISSFKPLSLVTRFDISIMYSLMLPFPLYRIETSLVRIVLVSTFSLEVNRSAICLRKLFAFCSSEIPPLMDSGIECCMIIRLMRFDRFHFSYADFSISVLSLVRAATLMHSQCPYNQAQS